MEIATGRYEQSLLDLFSVSDQIVNDRDYPSYSSLFVPHAMTFDEVSEMEVAQVKASSSRRSVIF